MKTIVHLSAAIAVAVVAAACASAPNESEILAAAMAQGDCMPPKPGRRDPPEEIVTAFRDSMPPPGRVMFEIAPEDPTLDLEMLRGLFRVSARTELHIGFWGEDSAVVRAIVLRALDQPSLRTEHLKVMFFGSVEDEALVATAVRARGGDLIRQ